MCWNLKSNNGVNTGKGSPEDCPFDTGLINWLKYLKKKILWRLVSNPNILYNILLKPPSIYNRSSSKILFEDQRFVPEREQVLTQSNPSF